jgi:hypothetical protein
MTDVRLVFSRVIVSSMTVMETETIETIHIIPPTTVVTRTMVTIVRYNGVIETVY